MSGSRYRVAIVGCGQIGALYEAEESRPKPGSHAGAALANPDTELVALVEIDAATRDKAHQLFPGARTYKSLRECVAGESLDIVVIATPPAARLELIELCVSSGIRGVVCEKPLASNIDDAAKIDRLIQETNTAFVLNYQRRFSPLFQSVKERISRGAIGDIQQVTCYYSNGLFNNGGHTIDALSFLLNDPIVSVLARTRELSASCPQGDMNADALMRTESGATVVLQSFDQDAYGAHDFYLFGTRGAFALTEYGTLLEEIPARPSVFAGVNQLERAQAQKERSATSATEAALAEIVSVLDGKGTARSTTTNGLTTLAVLAAIRESAESGGMDVRVS